jgi:predicted ABC-type ATPase
LDERPFIAVLAGPNGAGKSTSAATLLRADLVFLNADEVARSLPGYPSPETDMIAGRAVIAEMNRLERQRSSFAVETTLASRSLGPRIARLRRTGYFFELIFLWTPSAEFSVGRVARRVLLGGHSIPEDTIRRRYRKGLENLFRSFLPIADRWAIYDNTDFSGTRSIARGVERKIEDIVDPQIWAAVRGDFEDAQRLTGP